MEIMVRLKGLRTERSEGIHDVASCVFLRRTGMVLRGNGPSKHLSGCASHDVVHEQYEAVHTRYVYVRRNQ